MELVDFEAWWREFLADPRIKFAKDGGYAAEENLTRYIARLAHGSRAAFLTGMVEVVTARCDGWSLALATLEKNYDAHVLARLAKYAADLKPSSGLDDQAAASASLRVLTQSTEDTHRGLLKDYLLVERIGPYWTSVPWSLWPVDPDLFGRSWARYFSEVPDIQWRDTAVVQAFLQAPEALRCVRGVLQQASPRGWERLREAVMLHVDSQWLSDQDRQRVREVCG